MSTLLTYIGVYYAIGAAFMIWIIYEDRKEADVSIGTVLLAFTLLAWLWPIVLYEELDTFFGWIGDLMDKPLIRKKR